MSSGSIFRRVRRVNRRAAFRSRRRRFVRAFKRKNVMSKLVKFMKGEMRYSVYNTASFTPTQAGVFTCVDCMILGDDDLTREGKKITLHSLSVKGMIRPAPGATTTPLELVVRGMLIQASQNNGGTSFTNSELLLNSASNANNWRALTNPTFTGKGRKFHVLWDKTFLVRPLPNTQQAVGSTTYHEQSRLFRFVKLWKKGLLINYNDGNAGTAADIDKNCLYLVFYCNADAGAAVFPSARIRYTP